jgi:hypothetical protein
MTSQDHARLVGERSALQRMIQQTPADDVLDLGSLTARLEEIEHCIARAGDLSRKPAAARLTFNGRPVIGSHGVFADFGARAVGAFSEAVTAVAASLTGGLAAKGPIPNREQHQLLITHTALGSFGFELEEHRPAGTAGDEPSSLEQALARTRDLLQGTIETDDELLADLAADLDRRALDKVRAFIGTLEESEAVCTLQYQNQVFRFTDLGQVRRSLQRISDDNLREDEQTLRGQFQGFLPRRRTFEFRVATPDQVIAGKVAVAVADADEINRHLHQDAEVRVMETRVGTGQPRYLLLEMPGWPGRR